MSPTSMRYLFSFLAFFCLSKDIVLEIAPPPSKRNSSSLQTACNVLFSMTLMGFLTLRCLSVQAWHIQVKFNKFTLHCSLNRRAFLTRSQPCCAPFVIIFYCSYDIVTRLSHRASLAFNYVFNCKLSPAADCHFCVILRLPSLFLPRGIFSFHGRQCIFHPPHYLFFITASCVTVQEW